MTEFQEYPKMLYKCPGHWQHNDGITFDYLIAANSDEEKLAVDDGWYLVVEEAHAASQVPAKPATDLETQARELGIVVDRRWSEATLRQRIDEALAK